MSAAWWDPEGKFRALHELNPTRMQFIRRCAIEHFAADFKAPAPLEGLEVLDLGCGGGLVSEALARLGAEVTAVDASAENIKVASAHRDVAGEPLLDRLQYACRTGESLVEEGRRFDIVCSLEVVEHTADPAAFVGTCCTLVKPGGMLVLSTLNRTPQSLVFGKYLAEYFLRWADPGTHDWHRFITPDELKAMIAEGGLVPDLTRGICYSPLTDSWALGTDLSINYITSSLKPME